MDAVFCTPPSVRHGAPSSRTAPARRPRVGTAPCGGLSLPPGATDRDIAGAYEQVFQAALETPERRPFPIEKAEAAVGKALGNSAICDAYLDAIAERAADLQGDG
ncbi:hypothetical protein [Salinibacter ruber]|uniref:hypothetical protein n=1 Tax=Salinibacter ruber TaxID=146919 RepID=UPI0013C32040|nr:hypothetical protein [Salinibacter ruber]